MTAMFQERNNSADVPPGGSLWTRSELAQFKDYMGEAGFADVAAAEKRNEASAHAAPAGIGHNNPPFDPPTEPAARAEFFSSLVRDFLSERKTAEDKLFLKPEELGKTQDRAHLIERAILDGTAHITRHDVGAGEKGASAVLAVYNLDCVYSDNNKGFSWASA